MKEEVSYTPKSDQAEELKSFIKGLGVDLVGIADLHSLKGMPLGIPSDAASFLGHYHYAIMMGAQLDKLGKSASGTEVSLFLERAALAVVDRLERKGRKVLTVHTEDEFDPVNRVGLMSLKVLAKAAGLGWQGRSLMIVSPRYGPIHRWIGVLTDMKLRSGMAIPIQCGDCALCIEECPAGALNLVEFDDHPACREDVLDIGLCKGDDGCTECLSVCPWAV
jgi:epoxyqueuosine reductase QueG